MSTKNELTAPRQLTAPWRLTAHSGRVPAHVGLANLHHRQTKSLNVRRTVVIRRVEGREGEKRGGENNRNTL